MVIQSKILTPVANLMIGEGMLQRGNVAVSLKKGELIFDVKKKMPKLPKALKKDKELVMA